VTVDQEIALWAMFGQWAGAIATGVGLLLIWRQVRDGSRAADATALNHTYRAYSDELKSFALARTSENPADSNNGFYSLLNFLETQAAAVNGHLYGAVSDEIVRDLLRSVVADIESYPAWHSVIAAGVDSPDTYKHFRQFCQQERKKIDAIRNGRAAGEKAGSD
jgi:hypothetical protein